MMRVIMTNQVGINNGLQCALRRMKKYNHGKIVTTTSFAGADYLCGWGATTA